MFGKLFGSPTSKSYEQQLKDQVQRVLHQMHRLPQLLEQLDRLLMGLETRLPPIKETVESLDRETLLLVDLLQRAPAPDQKKEKEILQRGVLALHFLQLKWHQVSILVEEHVQELFSLEREVVKHLNAAYRSVTPSVAANALLHALDEIENCYRRFPKREQWIQERLACLIERVAAQCEESCANRSQHKELYNRLDPIWMATHRRASQEPPESTEWIELLKELSPSSELVSPFLQAQLSADAHDSLKELGTLLLQSHTAIAKGMPLPSQLMPYLHWQFHSLGKALSKKGGDPKSQSYWDYMDACYAARANLKAAREAENSVEEDRSLKNFIASLPVNYRETVFLHHGMIDTGDQAWNFLSYRDSFKRSGKHIVIAENEKGSRLCLKQGEEAVYYEEPMHRAFIALADRMGTLNTHAINQTIDVKKQALLDEAKSLYDPKMMEGLKKGGTANNATIDCYHRVEEIYRAYPSGEISDLFNRIEIPFVEARARFLADQIEETLKMATNDDDCLALAESVQPQFDELLSLFEKRPTVQIEMAARRARVAQGVVRLPALAQLSKGLLALERFEGYQTLLQIYDEIVAISFANERADTTALLNSVEDQISRKGQELGERIIDAFDQKVIPYQEVGRLYALITLLNNHLEKAVIAEKVDDIDDRAEEIAKDYAKQYEELRFSDRIGDFRLLQEKCRALSQAIPIDRVQKHLTLSN